MKPNWGVSGTATQARTKSGFLCCSGHGTVKNRQSLTSECRLDIPADNRCQLMLPRQTLGH